MYYMDVDNRDERFIQHLRHRHPNKHMWRYSSTRGIHAVLGIACELCQPYRDSRYDGNILFDNKGNKWAGEWYGTIIDTRPSLLICRIYVPRPRTQDYVSIAHGLDSLLSYKPVGVFYCFHSIRLFPRIKLADLSVDYQNEQAEETRNLPTNDYISMYNMCHWDGSKENYETNMVNWLNTMPRNPLGFVYKEEDLK